MPAGRGKTGLCTYYEYDRDGKSPTRHSRYGDGAVTVQRHPNGTTSYFLYDVAGGLSEKVTRKDADASVLVRFAYTRGAGGNPIAIEREDGRRRRWSGRWSCR